MPTDPTITYSPRLRRSLARTYAARREIRLHAALKDAPRALVDEILVHELAHITVHERYGDTVRPHGPEWQAVVRAAGYEPKIRYTIDDLGDALGGALTARRPRKPRATLSYDHRCPTCGMVRTAKKPVPRWRCAACVAAGLDGCLVITTRPRGGSK